MRRLGIPMVIAPVFIVGCAVRPNKPLATAGTLAELRDTARTREAMRGLADLQLEKQFGLRAGGAKREMAAPKPAPILAGSRAGSPNPAAAAASASLRESDQDFERRTTAEAEILAG